MLQNVMNEWEIIELYMYNGWIFRYTNYELNKAILKNRKMGSGGRLCGKDNGLGSHGPESEYQSPDCRLRGHLEQVIHLSEP